jgi:hypothetical protein
MNADVDRLSKEVWEVAVSMFDQVEDIKVTLINIRIMVAGMQENQHARGLDVIASHIEKSLTALTDKSRVIRDIAKDIGKANQSDELTPENKA